MATQDFIVQGSNPDAHFTLKVYRGEGAALLAMDWKNGPPPINFVGFAIEFQSPDHATWYPLKNRISFLGDDGKPQDTSQSSLLAPFQKFRWVHFPKNTEVLGLFRYRVTPLFWSNNANIEQGKSQEVAILLESETYPGKLNVAFTRGFISSQAFVEYYGGADQVAMLLPAKADDGVDFVPTHPLKDKALPWMGFEARKALLDILDHGLSDNTAKVYVVGYDLNQPEVLDRLKAIGPRLQIIIDDSATHGKPDAAESQCATILQAAGAQVKRQHMNQLQHNKTIVINGDQAKMAVCGSTNFSWRGWYVQSNNAIVVQGASAIQPFLEAFQGYWNNSPSKFGLSSAADWKSLGLQDIDAKITFSPHSASKAKLNEVAEDLKSSKSSVFYSLAFLSQTTGAIPDAIINVTNRPDVFVYGISDKRSGAIAVQTPSGKVIPVYAAELSDNLPEPFKSEPTGGFGTRMHHKFVVIDFNSPEARVYMGSYNFSGTADLKNGENLLCIRDQKVATAYMIQALCLFDHYHFRVAVKEAKKAKTIIALQKPPASNKPEDTWWAPYYDSANVKMQDRQLFA